MLRSPELLSIDIRNHKRGFLLHDYVNFFLKLCFQRGENYSISLPILRLEAFFFLLELSPNYENRSMEIVE